MHLLTEFVLPNNYECQIVLPLSFNIVNISLVNQNSDICHNETSPPKDTFVHTNSLLLSILPDVHLFLWNYLQKLYYKKVLTWFIVNPNYLKWGSVPSKLDKRQKKIWIEYSTTIIHIAGINIFSPRYKSL